MITTTKTCNKCKDTKDLGDFYKDPKGRDGLKSRCKPCHSMVTRSSKNYSKTNRAAQRRWREKNQDKCTESNRHKNRLRRIRKLGAEGSHTTAELRELWSRQEGSCAYCLGSITPDNNHLDHVHPLSRGGSDGIENLLYTCPPCNLSKKDKLLFTEWMPCVAAR